MQGQRPEFKKETSYAPLVFGPALIFPRLIYFSEEGIFELGFGEQAGVYQVSKKGKDVIWADRLQNRGSEAWYV